MKKETKPKICKEDFIEFISNMTPEELNEFVQLNGKPRKLYCPIIFSKNQNLIGGNYYGKEESHHSEGDAR